MTASTWTKSAIDAERAVVSASLAAAGEAPRDQLNVAVEQALERSGAPLVRQFLYACAALDLHARAGGLTASQVTRVTDLASSLLRVANINPATSKLSFLYGELHATLVRVHAREGRHEDALWDLHMAHHLSRKAPVHDATTRLTTALEADLRLGLGEAAVARLKLLEERADVRGDAKLALLAARTRWLTAEDDGLDEALARLAGAVDAAWLKALRGVREGGPLKAVGDAAVTDEQRTCAWFYARALPTPELAKRLGPAKSLPASELLKRCATELEQAQEAERPLHQRLRIAQRVFRDARRAGTIEAELLTQAAVVRWLLAYNQMELAASLLADWRAKNLGLTRGRRDDVFGALADVDLATVLRRYG